jgi:hypothetical protein
MSRLLNTLLDDAANAALNMLEDGGSVRSSMVMLIGDVRQDGDASGRGRAQEGMSILLFRALRMRRSCPGILLTGSLARRTVKANRPRLKPT